MDEQRLKAAIGLSRRSGNLASGNGATVKAIETGRAKLVLVDESASNRTRKNLCLLCETYRVPCKMLPGTFELARAAGYDTSKMLALLDANLAKMAASAIKAE